MHICCLERNSSVKHSIEYYSSAPDIRLEAFIALTSEDFRGNVCWSTTLLSLVRVSILNNLADSKIADLDISFRSKQNVVEFDVSVQDTLRVHILKTKNDLTEHKLGIIFL